MAPQSRAKYATGRGNAPKDQVLAATIKRYPHLDIIDNNAADAVLLASAGLRVLGSAYPNETITNTKCLEALKGITR